MSKLSVETLSWLADELDAVSKTLRGNYTLGEVIRLIIERQKPKPKEGEVVMCYYDGYRWLPMPGRYS